MGKFSLYYETAIEAEWTLILIIQDYFIIWSGVWSISFAPVTTGFQFAYFFPGNYSDIFPDSSSVLFIHSTLINYELRAVYISSDIVNTNALLLVIITIVFSFVFFLFQTILQWSSSHIFFGVNRALSSFLCFLS